MGSIVVGKRYEKLALHFLQKHGLSLIQQNYNQKTGEIDLILEDNEFLIFAEVRYRKPNSYASGLESIDYRKQRKIIKTAKLFLLQNKKYQNAYCRFDVLSISSYDNKTKIHWIKNAFSDTGYF